MKILNLFAGIGGNRTLWGDKHEITAVEYDFRIGQIYKKRFPNDEVLYCDAYEYNLRNYDKFDFIWASPPCPTHSITNIFLNAQGCKRYPDMKLYGLILFLERFCKNEIKWVVENVKPYYDPLKKPTFILGRHYFWSNILLTTEGFEYSPIATIACHNSEGDNRKRSKEEHLKELEDFHGFSLGSNFSISKKIEYMKNCVNPKIGKKILDSIKQKVEITKWLY